MKIAMKNGRKLVHRLETKVKELEGQLDEEQRRLVENQKNHRKCALHTQSNKTFFVKYTVYIHGKPKFTGLRGASRS